MNWSPEVIDDQSDDDKPAEREKQHSVELLRWSEEDDPKRMGLDEE